MSTATFTQATSLRAALRSAMASAIAAVSRRRFERRASAQLRAMSDRQLADIGIHRGQIDAVVRGLRSE